MSPGYTGIERAVCVRVRARIYAVLPAFLRVRQDLSFDVCPRACEHFLTTCNRVGRCFSYLLFLYILYICRGVRVCGCSAGYIAYTILYVRVAV